MKLTRVATLAVIALISAASLSACGPTPITPAPTSSMAAPPASPDPSSSPTPDPSTVAGFIVISGSGVGVGAINSASIVQIPFTTDGATAAALLSEAIGVEPVVADFTGTSSGCSADYRTYDWGGLQFRSPGHITTPGGQLFNAIVTAQETSSGLELATTYLQHIGTATADFATAVRGVADDDGSGRTHIYFDRQNPDAVEAEAWGAFAVASGGVVTNITSPLYFYGDC